MNSENINLRFENKYLDFLNETMNEFKNQKNKIGDLLFEISLVDADIRRNDNITEDKIRQWYLEDLPFRNISFDAYKKDSFEIIEKRRSLLNSNFFKLNNRYVAELFYMIQIKETIKSLIATTKKELEQKQTSLTNDLEIKEAIEILDSIDEQFELTEEELRFNKLGLTKEQQEIYNNLEKKIGPLKQEKKEEVSDELFLSKTDYDNKISEYERILEIYNEDLERLYDVQKEYETGKIEYSTYQKYANYVIERYHYMQEQYVLTSKLYTNYGEFLSLEESKLKDKLNKLQAELNDEFIYRSQYQNGLETNNDNRIDALQESIKKIKEELSRRANPYNGMTDEQLMQKINRLQSQLEDEFIYASQYENGLETNNNDYIEKLQDEIKKLKDELNRRNKKIKEILKPEQPMMIYEKVDKPIDVSKKEKDTLDDIIYKVCGEKTFNDKQSSKYEASKIKIFNMPKKDKLGRTYRVVSTIKSVICILPRSLMKLRGIFLTKETKISFKEMEERANKLTDAEVRILLKKYKGATAQSKKIPLGFNNAIKPRINKYISKKITAINEKINENLIKIEYCKKLISLLNEKLVTEQSPEMVEKMKRLLETAYITAADCIGSLEKLQKEGNSLQSGDGLHSFDEELKALNTKLNYEGGRFSAKREYDPVLWSLISKYSHVIENSKDKKEIVDAFIARENIYKENTKEKSSIFNLGSKVSAGKLDYRPFVETLNYGNDPLIRDLITIILTVSSIVNLVNNIKTNIANNSQDANINQDAIKEIEEYNKQIEAHNDTLASNQALINNIRNNGKVIEEDLIYDINLKEGAIANLAERGNNDRFNWDLSGEEFLESDAAIHAATSELSISNANQILELSNQYTSGAISHAEYISKLSELNSKVNEVYLNVSDSVGGYIKDYASAHPQYDYTAILSAVNNASRSAQSATQLNNFLASIYEQSINVTDLESLDLLESALYAADPASKILSVSLTPSIITLGAVGAKATHEEIVSQQEDSAKTKRDKEVKDMIEALKRMKEELTPEEIKEIEDFLSK